MDTHDDIELLFKTEGLKRLVDFLLVNLVREVVLQRTTVDGPTTGARHDTNARDGLLTTARCSAGSNIALAVLNGNSRGWGL